MISHSVNVPVTIISIKYIPVKFLPHNRKFKYRIPFSVELFDTNGVGYHIVDSWNLSLDFSLKNCYI